MGMIKTLLNLGLVFCLLLSISFKRKESLYQVISSHPHDLEEITPHIKTVSKEGRLWIVQLKKNAPTEIKQHLRALTGTEKSYQYKSKRFDPKTVAWINEMTKLDFEGGFNPYFIQDEDRQDIRAVVSGVDARNIESDVSHLAGYVTRYAGTDENKEALVWVKERFEQVGFKTSLHCFQANSCNLIAEKAGRARKSSVLLVMGHIDSVGEDYAGADDNASGVAVMLEMARVLASYRNSQTIRFLVTNNEELGLVGANAYARKLENEKQIKNLTLAINMDMVGYNSNGIVELETNPEFETLGNWFADLATRYTSLKPKITLGAWGSDHVPFLKRGVPTLLTIEDWNTKTPCYHQECDRPDTLNYNYAAEIARLNVSAVMTKDTTP